MMGLNSGFPISIRMPLEEDQRQLSWILSRNHMITIKAGHRAVLLECLLRQVRFLPNRNDKILRLLNRPWKSTVEGSQDRAAFQLLSNNNSKNNLSQITCARLREK